jgi:hypothetical protein
VRAYGWSQDLRVSADADDVVSMVGVVGLRMLADRTGLAAGLRRRRPAPHLGDPATHVSPSEPSSSGSPLVKWLRRGSFYACG